MLRQFTADIKALLASVISNGKLQVEGGTGGGASGTNSTNFTVATNLPVPDGTPIVVGTINTSNVNALGIQIQNNGSDQLSSFSIEVKSNSTGDWIPLFSQAAEFTTPPFGSPLKGASGDLTQLASGVLGWVNLDVSFYSSVRLKSASSNGTTLTVLAGGK